MNLVSENSEYQKLLRILNSTVDLGFFLFTITDKINVLYTSSNLLEFSGYTDNEVNESAKQLFNNYIYEDDNKNNFFDIKNIILKKELSFESVEVQLVCKNALLRYIKIKSNYIDTIENEDVFIFTIEDINAKKEINISNLKSLNKLETINQCAQSIISDANIETAIETALLKSIDYYQGDGASIYLCDKDNLKFSKYFAINRTFEDETGDNYCNIPYKVIATCAKRLVENNYLLVKNINEIAEECLTLAPGLFKNMENMLAIPYMIKNKIKGFVVIYNIKENYLDFEYLVIIAGLVFNELEKRNITYEFKQVEKAREDLLNMSKIGVISFIEEDNVIDINTVSEGIVELYNDSRENIVNNLNKDIYYYVAKEDLDFVKKNGASCCNKNVLSGDISYRIMIDGNKTWVSAKTTVVKKGKTSLVYSVITSIEEMKNLEKELALAKQSLEVAINGSNMSYWEYDLVNNWIYPSRAYVDKYNYPKVIKENVPYYIENDKLVLLEDRKKIISSLLELRNTPIKSVFYDYHLIEPNGRLLLKRDILTKVYDENNNPVKAVCLSMNIEEISKLRNENNLLNNLLGVLKSLGTDEFIDNKAFFKEILNSLVKTITQAEFGSILINDGYDRFKFVALYNYPDISFRDFVLDIEETNVYSYSQGKCDEAIIFHDLLKYDKDVIATGKIKQFIDSNTTAINTTLSCPIKINNKLIAIINLDSTLLDAFDDNDKKTIELFGMEVANFIKINDLIDTQKYAINHDKLTGVNSRLYFYNALSKYDKERYFPLSIVSIDANGLKLTNDTFGHSYGDSLLKIVGKTITNGLRSNDVIARVGGDEFMILMLNASKEIATLRMQQISSKMEKNRIKGINISISYGIATKDFKNQNIKKIIADSDAQMYQNKAFFKKMHQDEQIKDIMEYVFNKYPYERKRFEIIKVYVNIIGKLLFLDENEIKELNEIAYYHNIGKAGVNYDDDYKEIQIKHCEIGNLILCSSSSLVKYANIVLLHHEHYDGSGPLRNLHGEQIPLFSRIITVADTIAHLVIDKDSEQRFDFSKVKNKLISERGKKLDPEIVDLTIDYLQLHNFIS